MILSLYERAIKPFRSLLRSDPLTSRSFTIRPRLKAKISLCN